MPGLDELFSVLRSRTRREILKLLMKREMHVSGIARELGISVSQASKHIKLLLSKNLIEKKTFGRTHVLRAKPEVLYTLLDEFADEQEVEVEPGATVLDALKQIAGVRVESLGNRNFVVSIDGEDGYYVYEVNGRLPDISMDKYKIRENVTVELKKIVHIKKKRMKIKVKKNTT